jgi:hypothetical protein
MALNVILRRLCCAIFVLWVVAPTIGRADPAGWRREWPRTDFSRAVVDLAEIMSGGPPKDGIPAIDKPRFRPIRLVTDIDGREPVIGLTINGDARAYPLRILIWHEIVNDTVGDMPIAVTYCPLCNSAVVFDRRLGERVLSFGTTGKLRHSDLVMYDRETESWWQQFIGFGIVGHYAGQRLTPIAARLESLERFRERFPEGVVLVPTTPSSRPYGRTPYARYDQSGWPFLYRGSYHEKIAPLARVVVVGDQAWPLNSLRQRGRIEWGDLVLSWSPGQASALDTSDISDGWDVGNVTVHIQGPEGIKEAVYDVALAFAFFAFHPTGTLHVD